MNRENLRDLLFFSVVLLISVVGFIYIFTNGRLRVVESNSWVTHSYDVIIAAQKIEPLPNRMLLEERSFLLTGETSFLNSYRTVLQEVDMRLETLQKLTADNAEQVSRLTTIRALFGNFTQQLEHRIKTLGNRSFNLSNFMHGYDELEITHTELLASIRDFLTKEQGVLIARTQETSDKRQQYFTSLIIGGTIGVILLLTFNTFLFFVHSKRQQVERKLEDSQRRFQLAMHGTNDGIFDLDASLSRIFYSRQFFDLLGREPVAGGLPLEDMIALVHPDDRENVRRNIDNSITNQTSEYSDMYRLSHADGRWVWVNSRGRCILGPDRKVERLIGATTDTTYLRLYQEKVAAEKEQAEKASAAKSAFLAHMSHEIRTPLTAISGVAEILQRNMVNLSDKQKQLVEVLHTSSMSLRELITDILDFSRIESGQVELDEREINIGQLLNQVRDITSIAAQEKGIKYIFDPESLADVDGVFDNTRLRQILINLVGNAIKFTEQGSVTVLPQLITIEDQRFLSVSVIDTGIGIADNVKEKIFERFMQGDTFITKQFGGTGLGLTISQSLAKLMGGHIKVHSVLGKGSTFTLVIPYRTTGEPIFSNEQIEPSKMQDRLRALAIGEKKVLLAEDYAGNIAVISFILEEMGLAYDVAGTGKEAIEKWQSGHYDVILMDVQMPEMDGFTAARSIRALEESSGLQRTPIICMTAHAMMQDKDEGIASGMDDYLPKPIFGNDLRDMLARYLYKNGMAAA